MSKYIVLFDVTPSQEGKAQYLELAAMLKPMLEGFDGFVSMERFQSLQDENKVLTMHVWDNDSICNIIMRHRAYECGVKCREINIKNFTWYNLFFQQRVCEMKKLSGLNY